MARVEVGERVGAILQADDATVHLLGFGVYDGYHEPPTGPFGGEPIPGWVNPRITLDDGSVVWGYECWWGSEERVRANIGSRTVIPATIERAASSTTETDDAAL